jgi:D-tagatose-1,6-bisphosphate aldolase subunit GatZ/KbaZ
MESGSAAQQLRRIFSRNRSGQRAGTYAVCSAHPEVLEAAVSQSIADGSLLHIESTSSQVNQDGGYTGMSPADFVKSIRALASRRGLPPERLLLGADHLGPFAWREENASAAMNKACELAREVVRAGYQKIHLDASMTCADDGPHLDEKIIAERAAVLCEAEEAEADACGCESPIYVVGTEVPPPGGEVAEGTCPPPTRVEDVHRTLEIFKKAFLTRRLTRAWENVGAVVVQPGVEFGNSEVFDYERAKARDLVAGLPKDSDLVYEAHSTDYQTEANLAALVEDHFAILKVGPWLTFAYREAVFALSRIENEVAGERRGAQLSQVREALDQEMNRNPSYWRSYYVGDPDEVALARAYSFSDRSRYYWPAASVQQEVAKLLRNMENNALPLTLLSQYLPVEYEAVRRGDIENRSEQLIQYHIKRILKHYATACGVKA